MNEQQPACGRCGNDTGEILQYSWGRTVAPLQRGKAMLCKPCIADVDVQVQHLVTRHTGDDPVAI